MSKHYQFREKLIWKGQKSGTNVNLVREDYTTRTCGLCGEVNHGITLEDREFDCVNRTCANQNIDRDYHAARNILIKWLTEAI